MKVVGTGIDLVEVPRFQALVERNGERILKRLFTPSELAYSKARRSMMQHLAARFAAKEAVVKALGAPKGLGLNWVDLEITHDPSGKPEARFSGTMERWKHLTVHLSLTHTTEVAVATALIVAP